MVAAQDRHQDIRLFNFVGNAVADKEIVNAPTRVALSGAEAHTPPAVHPCIGGVQIAEAVGEAGSQQLVQLAALLIAEARRAAVRAGVFQVDILVCDVQIPADDDGLFGIQLLQVGAQVVLPLHTVVDARQLVLRVGDIEVDKVKIGVFQRDGASLVVVQILLQPVAHRQGGRFCPDRRAGVTLFVGAVNVLGVAGGGEVCLAGLHFGFLYAEKVGVQRVKLLLKAFL